MLLMTTAAAANGSGYNGGADCGIVVAKAHADISH
jgi:hypothetical protein